MRLYVCFWVQCRACEAFKAHLVYLIYKNLFGSEIMENKYIFYKKVSFWNLVLNFN